MVTKPDNKESRKQLTEHFRWIAKILPNMFETYLAEI